MAAGTRASALLASVLLASVLLAVLLLPACSSDGPDPAAGERSTTSPTSAPRSSAAPAPESGPEARVGEVLAGLDRQAQIAQLFVVGVPLDALAGGDALAAEGVGGLFMAGRSSAPAEELAAVTGRWASAAPGPRPWVAADQEGGQVQALQGAGFERLPSARAQGDLPPEQLAALADRMGAALSSAGVTLDLAPVVDVVPAGTERSNPPIGVFDRQYGSTAAEVSAAAGAVVEGLAAHDVTATLKHFPGLGRVSANTDTAARVVDTVTVPGDEQVAVFAQLAGLPAAPFVMTSSAVYQQIDPSTQAAFSPVVITQLLRDRLGFDGVVISDDLGNAAAVRDVPVGERAVRFLAAGGTLVLTVEPDTYPAMLAAVVARDAADPAFAAAVDAAVRTALLAKAHAGLL